MPSGFKPAVADHAVLLEDVLDLDFIILQGSLQGIVRKGILKEIEGVNYQIPAISLVQRTCPDHGKIRCSHAIGNFVFDSSKRLR